MSKNLFKENNVGNLSLFLLMGILSFQTPKSFAQTIQETKIIAINPGHFPTDKLGGTGTPGKDATEYQLNLKTAHYLQEQFTYDSRFDAILTKNGENFNEPFSTEISNQSRIKKIREKTKYGTPKVNGFKPQGNPNPTPKLILRKIYSTRLILEERTDIDIILNLHHDWSAKPDSGHSIILSPYNLKYQETKNLTLCILEELNKKQNLSTQENFPNDSIPNFPKYMQEDRMELRNKGVRFRKLLPEIGNHQIPAKKPTILIEYNFAKKISINDEEYFRKMARATYLGVLKYYNLPEITLDKKLELNLARDIREAYNFEKKNRLKKQIIFNFKDKNISRKKEYLFQMNF